MRALPLSHTQARFFPLKHTRARSLSHSPTCPPLVNMAAGAANGTRSEHSLTKPSTV